MTRRRADVASALLTRLSRLLDELLELICKQVDIYGEGRPVPTEDLRATCRDNLEFALLHLGNAVPLDLTAPRRTGRCRADQGAPLAEVQRAVQVGYRFLWDALVAEARRSGSLSDADLVGLAAEVWALHDEFTAAMASAYRDALTERMLVAERERSALVEALFGGRILDTATVWEAADLLALPYQGWFVVVAAEVPPQARHTLQDIESRLRARGIASAWLLGSDLHVGIVSLRSPRALTPVVEQLRSAAASRIGVSPGYAELERTPQALHLARIAMASVPPGAVEVCLFDDAPLPVLVVSSPTTSYRVARMVLGPLLEINPDEREMLLHTLATYYAVRGSATEAGKRLYCHPNTVRHRLRRIERQTRRSLDDPLASAELYVAMEALRRLPDITKARVPQLPGYLDTEMDG